MVVELIFEILQQSEAGDETPAGLAGRSANQIRIAMNR
jgi:hypothetical protein